MDHWLLLHSLSSLVRPVRLGSSLYGLSSSFLGHQLEAVPDAGLQQWYGSHRFFSLRICLFVACGLGCSVRPSLWACQVNLLGRTLRNHKNLQKRINRRRVVVTGFGCSDSTRLGLTSGCSWEGVGNYIQNRVCSWRRGCSPFGYG